MGVVIGLLFISGVLLIFSSLNSPERTPRNARSFTRRIVVSRKKIALALVCACAGALITFVIVHNWVFAGVIGLCVSIVPHLHHVTVERKKRERAREQWPDVLDDVVSGLRAGLSIGESLASLAERGPKEMRENFSVFADELQATARLDSALNRLKNEMKEPVADKVVESMRLASKLGGHDLATLLSDLAAALRAENRARGELMARQSWTRGGAKVAAAAPWVVLALLSTRPNFSDALTTAEGSLVLLFGFVCTVIAYVLMVRIGRLREAPRVLARGNE